MAVDVVRVYCGAEQTVLSCELSQFCRSVAGGKGAEEAAENRNYLTSRMTDELHEIIRVLQLTTYDEDEWDADNLTVMKKAQNAIQSKFRNAKDWLEVSLSRVDKATDFGL